MTDITQTELMKIPFSKLLKIELPRFAERVMGIVEQNNPEKLKIKKLYDFLVAEQPRIDVLIDKPGAHPLTADLRKLRKMRALYISSIRFHLKVVIMEDESGVNKDVKMVRDEINHFLYNLDMSRNEEMYNQKIAQFYATIENNEELSDALMSLKFAPHLEKLKRVHDNMQTVIGAKLRSIAQRPKETTAELTNAVLKATKNLIKQIEIAPLLHPELDYAPLYKEMNQLLSEYRDIINKRALSKKRKAENIKSEQVEPIKVTTTSIQAEEPAEVKQQLNAEEVHANELEVNPNVLKVRSNSLKARPSMLKVNKGGLNPQTLEKEKIIAMSSKTIALPFVDDNET